MCGCPGEVRACAGDGGRRGDSSELQFGDDPVVGYGQVVVDVDGRLDSDVTEGAKLIEPMAK